MLIVDMEMPRGCYFCPMSATYPTDWYCMAHDDSKSIDGCAPMNERPSWCPIKGELVTCGECKHHGIGARKIGQGFADDYCGIHGKWFDDEYYCADGERKE